MRFLSSALSSGQQMTIDPTLGNAVLMFIDQDGMGEIVIDKWKTVMSYHF